MRRPLPFSSLIVLVLLALPAPVAAQSDEEAAPPPPELVTLEELNLRLLPLRRDELKPIVEEWMARLEEHSARLSALRVEALGAEGEAKTALSEQIAALRLEKAAVADRAEVAIESLKAKGGEVEEYELYIDAVQPVEIDVTDTSTLWASIKAWIVSENGGVQVGLDLLKALTAFVAAWIIAIIASALVRKALGRIRRTSALLRDFLVGLTRKSILIIGAVIAVSMLGVNIGPLIAAIGAAGLVIGFALQGTLSNFASGIMILIYRPYDVGHAVEIGGRTGKVDSMTLVTTTIITPDNQKIIVPNNSVWGGIIMNITGRKTRRVDMTFGIGYDDDIDRARDVLADIVGRHELVLDDPAPIVQVSALADSSVNFIVRPWVKTDDYWKVFWEVTAEVKRRFDAEGISIPYPQRDVHLHQVSAAPSAG